MQEIDAHARTVRDALQSRRYGIDFFQREYRWQNRQIAEFISDLTEHFLEHHEAGHELGQVAGYGRYFLGSFITSSRDGLRFLVDGQQRLTTRRRASTG